MLSNIHPEAQQKAKNTAAIRIQEIEPATLVMQEKSFEKSVAKVPFNFFPPKTHLHFTMTTQDFVIFCDFNNTCVT